MASARKLFCFGFGYSARALASRLGGPLWRIGGTCRRARQCALLRKLGIESAVFDGEGSMSPSDAFDGASHVLLSVPPDANGDPVLRWLRHNMADPNSIKWVAYLSTTGVYGDQGGAWVDETSPLRPTSDRAKNRVTAEDAWLGWGARHGVAVQVFRLAGIYGPGRSALERVRQGTAQRIRKPGHLFSRIHVDDIANVLAASIARPQAGAVYNVCDDEPAASSDVVAYACTLCSITPPPEIPFAEAELSPAARSFWTDNRRVRNDLIKRQLGVELAFPNYRTGLRSIAGL
ncbi:MAG: SDR family oxidoreductase [Alphaproteobacteria bacterium]|nr:SDR family oxidoreductase [Alphaproteobacteria bacterium]